MLDVGDGHRLWWETCGSPEGKPAVVLHGGPGSGCTPWHRRMFDPDAYRIVVFDQRCCGRSTPHASEPSIDLSSVTTSALVADLEALRTHLDVDRWLVWGGSWGSTLALAYAEAFPERVTEMILWGVTTGRHAEIDWLFRGGLEPRFPDASRRLREAVGARTDREVPAACSRLLHDADPAVRERAATAWCRWESAVQGLPLDELAERYRDPRFALAFARLVTWFVSNDEFLDDGVLIRGAGVLRDIPIAMVNGSADLQAPTANAEALLAAAPHAELVVIDDAGHGSDEDGITGALIRASDRFAVT
jgi:proline iminopeptidase